MLSTGGFRRLASHHRTRFAEVDSFRSLLRRCDPWGLPFHFRLRLSSGRHRSGAAPLRCRRNQRRRQPLRHHHGDGAGMLRHGSLLLAACALPTRGRHVRAHQRGCQRHPAGNRRCLARGDLDPFFHPLSLSRGEPEDASQRELVTASETASQNCARLQMFKSDVLVLSARHPCGLLISQHGRTGSNTHHTRGVVHHSSIPIGTNTSCPACSQHLGTLFRFTSVFLVLTVDG